MRLAKKKQKQLPYWLEGVEEICPRCMQRCAYAVETRCDDCDSALCPMCRIVVKAEIFCSPCEASKARR